MSHRPYALLSATWITGFAYLALNFALSDGAWAVGPTDKELLRVEIPLTQTAYRDTHLGLQDLITTQTYVDVKHFHLRGVEVIASTPDDGALRLQVGRFISPRVAPDLVTGPGTQGVGGVGGVNSNAEFNAAPSTASTSATATENHNPQYIAAPNQKSQKDWHLVFEDQVNLHQLTVVLEPRSSALALLETQRPTPIGADPGFGDRRESDLFFRRNRFDTRSGVFLHRRSDPFRDDLSPWGRQSRQGRFFSNQQLQRERRAQFLRVQRARAQALQRARRNQTPPTGTGSGFRPTPELDRPSRRESFRRSDSGQSRGTQRFDRAGESDIPQHQ